MFSIISWICYLVITKGHVAYRQIKLVIRKMHPFKTVYREVGLGLKLSGDPASNGI